MALNNMRHPVDSKVRINNAVDSVRRMTKNGADKIIDNDPVYSFLIDGSFYHVFDHLPNRTWTNNGNKAGQYVFKNVKRCFSDMYAEFPDSFIGCYDQTAERQDMIDDFTLAVQEILNED
mgnify:FL=1